MFNLQTIDRKLVNFSKTGFSLFLQADVSGTIVKWLVDNGAQITPGQVCHCRFVYCPRYYSNKSCFMFQAVRISRGSLYVV